MALRPNTSLSGPLKEAIKGFMNNTTRGGKTAGELLAELDADPAVVARRSEQNEARTRRVVKWRKAEAPLVAELRKVGEEVETVWDLVNTSRPYPRAIPVLIKHLQIDYPDRVREGIARALAVRDAKVAWDVLLELFKKDDDRAALGSKAAIGLALSAAANDEVLDDIIGLIRDRAHGANRIALLEPLCRSAQPRASEVLEELRNDPDLSFEVKRALRLKHRRTRSK